MTQKTVVDQVKQMMDAAFSSQAWGNKIFQAQGVDSRMLTDVAPIDDQVPPFGPENLRGTPFLGAISVQWDMARRYDYVKHTVVEYIATTGDREGEINEVEATSGPGIVLYQLDFVPYTIRAKHVDLWNRESDWSEPITVKPNETAEYKIDLEKARQLGNVSSIMSIINDSLISGENFAAGTVRQISLATPEHPNQLPLIEVDFDQWDAGTVWPPTDSPKPINEVAQPPYIKAQIPLGITAKVEDYAGRRWLQVTRGTATTPDPSIYPFADWKRRETQPDNFYIASVYVQGDAGTIVRFGAQAATNTTGTSVLDLGQTEAVTLDGSPEGQRIAFKFFMGSNFPYIRFRLDTLTDNKVSRWTRFQLEQADEFKTEPGPWTPGVMSVGVVNSRLLTAIDANIANALFKNAAIESAAISSLTADKIEAGVLNAGIINVATLLEMHQGGFVNGENAIPGTIKAGGVHLTSNGLSMLSQDSYNAPATQRTQAIYGRNANGTPMAAAIAFYDDTRPTEKYRGIVARADGDSANDGLIALHATNDGNLSSQTTAKVEVRASKAGNPGVVTISRKLNVAEIITANDFKLDTNQSNNSLKDHKHSWDNDITNKPSLNSGIKDGDTVDNLYVKRLFTDPGRVLVRP